MADENQLKFTGNLKKQFTLTMIAFGLSLYLFNLFASFVESRPGVRLADPVIAALAPTNLTWLIFLFIYLALILAVIELVKTPHQLLHGVQAYVCLVISRVMVMYLTPLDPPAGMILLRDPIVEFFASERLLTRDLFFSGHTATLFLLFLVVPSKRHKVLFLVSTIIVAVSLMFQHVHYTTDIVAAPFFSYGCYRVVGMLRRACGFYDFPRSR